jgi:hypothetical protein
MNANSATAISSMPAKRSGSPRAQPLDPDHPQNLAKLYRNWAKVTPACRAPGVPDPVGRATIAARWR